MGSDSATSLVDLSEVYARLNRVHFSGRLRNDVELRWVDDLGGRKAQVVFHAGGAVSFDLDRTQHKQEDRMGIATTLLSEMHRAKSLLSK